MLNKKNIRTILYWFNVKQHELDVNDQDIAAFKKLMDMIPESREKESLLYQFNERLERQK